MRGIKFGDFLPGSAVAVAGNHAHGLGPDAVTVADGNRICRFCNSSLNGTGERQPESFHEVLVAVAIKDKQNASRRIGASPG